jgi:hypothetical protein
MEIHSNFHRNSWTSLKISMDLGGLGAGPSRVPLPLCADDIVDGGRAPGHVGCGDGSPGSGGSS